MNNVTIKEYLGKVEDLIQHAACDHEDIHTRCHNKRIWEKFNKLKHLYVNGYIDLSEQSQRDRFMSDIYDCVIAIRVDTKTK